MVRTRFPHPYHGVGSESVINSESFTLSIEAKPVISDGYPQAQRLGVLSSLFAKGSLPIPKIIGR